MKNLAPLTISFTHASVEMYAMEVKMELEKNSFVTIGDEMNALRV